MDRKTRAARLLMAALGCAGLTLAVRLGLGAALRALFRAWNVNAQTASRAPGWARALFVWQGSILSALSALAVIALTVCAFGVKLPVARFRPVLCGWLVGTGMALGSAALFLLTDSLRPERTAPNLTPGLFLLWLLSLLTALSEELFTKGVLYDTAGRRWGTVLATLAFFLINGGMTGNVVSGVNVALMGVACCLIYARYGLWADVAFRWGWSFAAVFLLGQGGGESAVWRLYGVSETRLTGGDAGFAYGLWLTALLAALIVGLLPKRHLLPKLN